jgi:hypothetical protein
MNPDLMMQAPAMLSAQMHGPWRVYHQRKTVIQILIIQW